MKKLTLFTLMLTIVTVANAYQGEVTIEEPVEYKISNDEIKQKISTVRNELGQAGFSTEMMNNLFGDENFYFPSTRDKLQTVMHIIDKLIANKQYEEAQKPILIRLANDAYSIYNKDNQDSRVDLHE